MAIELKKIMWPTDFSELSMLAGDYAAALRDQFGAELHVVHVCPPLVSPELAVPMAAGFEVSMSDKDLTRAAGAHLAELVDRRFGGDKTVVHEALSGTAWREICAYARRARIDLIVVASHGSTGLRHVLMGSTAERLVQHASCPVLAVKSPREELVE